MIRVKAAGFLSEESVLCAFSVVARSSRQMEGKFVVARLTLSSGLRCNLALHPTGVAM